MNNPKKDEKTTYSISLEIVETKSIKKEITKKYTKSTKNGFDKISETK